MGGSSSKSKPCGNSKFNPKSQICNDGKVMSGNLKDGEKCSVHRQCSSANCVLNKGPSARMRNEKTCKPLGGGSINYEEKYRKYKQKYLELKQSQ